MTKDKRYTLVKNQISGGYVKTFREIFEIIPKTVVSKDLKIHNLRFGNMLNDMARFELGDLYRIAALIEVDEKIILDLAHAQYLADKKGKRKK
jgi:hypothetical protein